MTPRYSLFSLLLACLLVFSGCGDSEDDLMVDLTPDSPQLDLTPGVAHQSWGSYRLYRYEAGTWQVVIDLGNPIQQVPLLGENPVMIVHGLGSRINTGRFNRLADGLIANGATSVFGFEYDTLDPIGTNSTFFTQSLDFLTSNEEDRTWRFVAHSMGALVSRSSFESGVTFDMATNGNLVSFPAGPHLGSEVAEELRDSDPDLVQQALQEAVLNGSLDFRNADGSRVDVTGNEPVFPQLAPNSSFLNAVNFEAANMHPQFLYKTVAGTTRGDDFEALNRLLGVFADDGLVNVESANAQVIGPVDTATVPFDHSDIVEEQPALLVIYEQLGLLNP